MADPKLSSFLVGLSKNSSDMNAFKADPQAAMAKAGLSSEAQVAVLSKNASLISSTIGRAGSTRADGDADTTVVVVVL